MADYTAESKFDPSKGYTEVKFGANSKLLEVELNELQQIQNEARASLVREQVHSGFLRLGEHRSSSMYLDQPNAVHLYGGSVRENFNDVVINGYILNDITNNGDTILEIKLPAPPTEGSREDFGFLEAWFEEIDSSEDPNIVDGRLGVETARRMKLNWRMRGVGDVDFSVCPEGFTTSPNNPLYSPAYPQGGNDTPIDLATHDTTTQYRNCFVRHVDFGSGLGRSEFFPEAIKRDNGLYLAGDGSQASKDLLKTADGYVYAIPVARIKRRNNAEYGVNNGNGARDYFAERPTIETINGVGSSYDVEIGKEYTLGFSSPIDVSNFKSGDPFNHATNGSKYWELVEVIDSSTVKVIRVQPNASVGLPTNAYIVNPKVSRPDGLYANVIDLFDIVDLRHKVSATGFSYDQLLEDNFDNLLRGKLHSSKNITSLKTYHGIPKTPIDSNHIFYASFDGTTTPEVGSYSYNSFPEIYHPMPTGLGVYSGNEQYAKVAISSESALTIESWFKTDDVYRPQISGASFLIGFTDTNERYFGINKHHSGDGVSPSSTFRVNYGSTYAYMYASKPQTEYMHVRVTANDTEGKVRVYFNGKLVSEQSTNILVSSIKEAWISRSTGSWGYVGTMADVAVSSIDRGDVFATLPKDFIEEYAVAMPAFNKQRKVYADSQVSQNTTSIAKTSDKVSDRGITVTKGTGTNTTIWEAGDTIKVKGVAGEVVTGVIDSDTVLAKMIVVDGTDTVIVDDVTGLSAGDTVGFMKENGIIYGGSDYTIQSIDTATKSVTFNSQITTGWDDGYIVESTATTSAPVVEYYDGTTLRTVTGTWTNLARNEATFTIGTIDSTTNVNLDTEDIRVKYSISAPAGQPGTSEVPRTVLAGEYLGKRLVKQSSTVGNVAVMDDFADKVSGSTAENPHIAKYEKNSVLLSPYSTAYDGEATDIYYDGLRKLDGSTFGIGGSTGSGYIAQILISFNVVEMLDRKYPGIFADCLNMAEKVAKTKELVYLLDARWYGYGSGVHSFAYWRLDTASWNDDGYGNGDVTASSPTQRRINAHAGNPGSYFRPANMIDDSGMVHYMAYDEPNSDTHQSNIYTDYFNLEVELHSKEGYDLLVPENPRRDDGQAGVLYVRRATKEVETFVNADEDFGIVTYTDYIPYQGIGIDGFTKAKVLNVANQAFLTTLGTGKYASYTDSNESGIISTNLPSPFPDHEYTNDPILDYIAGGNGDYTNTTSLEYIRNDYMYGIGSYGSTRLPLKAGVTLNLYGSNLHAYVCRGSSKRFSLEKGSVTYSGGQSIVKFTKPRALREISNGLIALPFIVEYEGRLLMGVVSYDYHGREELNFYSQYGVSDLFEISGRPLVKGVN